MKPTGATSEAASNSDATPALGMIEWSIPVRPGVVGKLVLPDSLTHREAQKVVKVVTALAHAFEEQFRNWNPLTFRWSSNSFAITRSGLSVCIGRHLCSAPRVVVERSTVG